MTRFEPVVPATPKRVEEWAIATNSVIAAGVLAILKELEEAKVHCARLLNNAVAFETMKVDLEIMKRAVVAYQKKVEVLRAELNRVKPAPWEGK